MDEVRLKPAVAVDLDGVLADYTKGFQGIENIGEPIPGAVEFIHRLSEFARVIVFTTRCKEYLGAAPGPKDHEPDRRPKEELQVIVTGWLVRHGFRFSEVYIGQGKPFAHAYVDDRAVLCRPQDLSAPGFEDALTQIADLVTDGYLQKAGPILQKTEGGL